MAGREFDPIQEGGNFSGSNCNEQKTRLVSWLMGGDGDKLGDLSDDGGGQNARWEGGQHIRGQN